MNTSENATWIPPYWFGMFFNRIRYFFKKMTRKFTMPKFAMIEIATNFWLSKALGVVTELNLADILKEKDLSIEELAIKSECKTEALYRFMRALAGEGVFKEKRNRVFTHTKLSLTLCEGEDSVKHFIRYSCSSNNWDQYNQMLECLKTGKSASNILYGMEGFERMEKNEDKNDRFNKAMTDISNIAITIITQSFPFSKYNKIVDIGGGQGKLLCAIIDKFGNTQGILFDQIHVVSKNHAFPHLEERSNRIEIVSGSFFDFVPEGGDLYILKNVLHDWNDEDASKILKNLKDSMNPKAKLIIVEYVFRPDNKPNYGKVLDIQMLISTQGGIERTQEQYTDLLKVNGFKLNRIIPTLAPFSLIEAERNS